MLYGVPTALDHVPMTLDGVSPMLDCAPSMLDLAPAILDRVPPMPDGLPLMLDPVSVTPAHFQRFQRVFPGFTHRKCYYYHKLRNHRMVSGANFQLTIMPVGVVFGRQPIKL